MTNKFLFNRPICVPESIFCLKLRHDIFDKDDLFRAMYYGLWFPAYFGYNWDALFECLCDLSWIKEKTVLIYHDAIPALQNNNIKTYLEILNDVCYEWEKNKDKEFFAVFPEFSKELIIDILN